MNNHLRWFYTELKPKTDLNCEKENEVSNEYHKNTLKGIRSAINRQLSDIGRDMDIVHDKAFKQANGSLAGKLKQNIALGLSQYLSSISCLSFSAIVSGSIYPFILYQGD